MRLLMTLLLLLFLLSCKGQDKESGKQDEKALGKTEARPGEKWKVFKEFDEEGNLIRYDSVYTWSYKDIAGDSVRVNLDSIMTSFRKYFEEESPLPDKDYFFYFPRNDSLFLQDFFQDDYFHRNWKEQHLRMEEMMRDMDSIRNKFLRDTYPGLKESAI